MLVWIICAVLFCGLLAAVIKIYLLKRSIAEIREGFSERVLSSMDTNTLISVSSQDKEITRLAAVINSELRELRRLKRQFEQGDRELREAVTNISHDLRTPLTAICGYLDLMQSQPMNESTKRYVSLISERTSALKLLTEELFRYSIILSADEEPSLADISLNAAVEDAVAGFYGALTGRGITPEISICENEVIRRLDKGFLSRILGNVLSNALKYSDGDLGVTLSPDGVITVSNTASSLSEVQVGRLFDRFYTVEAARSSTGLGLSIAKTLCEKMGGSISAEYVCPQLSIIIGFPSEG